MARVLEFCENAEKTVKATPPPKAEAKEMMHREVAELKDAALTNKTKDKVDQGDVFNSLTR